MRSCWTGRGPRGNAGAAACAGMMRVPLTTVRLPLNHVVLVVVLLFALPMLGQSNTGELRLKVSDPQGAGVKTAIELVSQANDFHDTFVTDDSGALVAKRLAFGVYPAQVQQPGFAPVSVQIEIRSSIPVQYSIKLAL